MPREPGWRWLPGALVAALGVLAAVAGVAIGGPEALDGAVIGAVAVAAGMVMIVRRASD